MRPVVVKPATQGDADKEEEGAEDDQPQIPSDIENAEASSSDDEEDSKKKTKKKPAAKAKKPAAARKISANATSHMNFRKLNIKNKNSKGKGGGRFGRRR